MHSFIKTVDGRNINVFSKKGLDTVRSEYGEIVNASEISIRIDKTYDVWNESDIEGVPGKNGKHPSSFLIDDDRSLSFSSKFYNLFKDIFPNYKWKHNVSINLWHEVYNKNLEYFMVDNKQELLYDSKYSADV